MPVHRLELSVEGQQSLRSQLGAMQAGFRRDLTTPLIPWEAKDDPDLGRLAAATSLQTACSLDDTEHFLRPFEVAKRAGHGSFSRTPGYQHDSTLDDSLEKQVRRYYTPRPTAYLDVDACRYADRAVLGLYNPTACGRLKPLTLLDAATRGFAGNSSGLGFPVVSSNRERYLGDVFNVSEEIEYDGWDVRWVSELPGIAGMRGQPRGPYQFAKARFIFQVPRALTNIEKMVQSPCLQALRRNPRFCGWNGAASVAQEMSRLLSKRREILSLDFKRFDASVPSLVIDRIFSTLGAWFTPESEGLLHFCREVFNKIGILVPPSTVNPSGFYSGEERVGGIPSGSCLTNLVGSLVNLWVMHYAAYRCGVRIVDSYVNGDDGVYTFSQKGVLIGDLSTVLFTDLGMKISEDKTLPMSCEQVHFLQDVHSIHYVIGGVNVGVRPLQQVSNAMWSYESVSGPDWNRPYDSVRWCMQLSMAVNHPQFAEACDWLYASDPCLREVMCLVENDEDFVAKAVRAVSKKDSNSYWGLSPSQVVSSPVFQYLRLRPS